ncbi:MAG: DUF4173 domain-containing protein [Candidatus Pacebacteria bacterium]|nr:DUF4173 domain-containing protein [Candidatus Paceibacterota bacterium]
MFGLLVFFTILYIIWYLFFSKRGQKKNQPAKSVPLIKLPKLLPLSLAVIIAGFNIFLYGTSTNLSLPVIGLAAFNLCWLAGFLVVFRKDKYSLLTWGLAVVSILSGLFLNWRANGFAQSINLIVIFAANLALIFVHAHEVIVWKILWLAKQVIKFIPLWFKQVWNLLRQPQAKGTGRKTTILTIIKTLTITIIVLVFFIGLLSSADPVFAELIEKFRDEIVGRTVVSLVLAFIVMVVVTLRRKPKSEDRWNLKFFSFSDVFIPIAAVVSLFAVFLVIQVKYLYGSHEALQSFDLTYSEYVRKGFIELLLTTFFGGLIAYLAVLKSRLIATHHQRQLKIINVVLIGELFAMLLSALKRDLMYVEVYGLTRVRIVGGMFLAWLAGLLILLIVMTLYQQMKERQLFRGLAILSVLVWLSLNIFNVDQMVAVGTPGHHNYKDYFYLNNLSEDAWQVWRDSVPALAADIKDLTSKAELTDVEKSRLAGDKLALVSLQEKRQDLFLKYAPNDWLWEHCETLEDVDWRWEHQLDEVLADKTDDINSCQLLQQKISEGEEIELPAKLIRARKWQHFSWPEFRAYQEISNNQDLYFKQVDELLAQVREYQVTHDLSLYEQEKWFLNEFSYPFIFIDLDYHAEDLTHYDDPSSVGEAFSPTQKHLMAQNPFTVKSLADGSCDLISSPQEVTLRGMMQEVESLATMQKRYYRFWDDSSQRDGDVLMIIVDRTSQAAFSFHSCYGCSKTAFVQVKLRLTPEEIGEGHCRVLVEAIEAQEVLLLL